MSSYLSLSMTIDAKILNDVFEILFNNSFFSPAAIGARAAPKHWFLSGYVLETFIERSLRGRKKPASFTLDLRHTPDGEGYLERMANCVRSWRAPDNLVSPFEMVEPGAPATFVTRDLLTAQCLPDLNRWLALFPQAEVTVFGCVSIGGISTEFPWHRAFRDLHSERTAHDSGGDCFLEISMRPTVLRSSNRIVNLLGRSETWLVGEAGGTRYRQATNLERLSTFVRPLLQLGTGVELRLEGREFQAAEALLCESFDLP